MEQKSEEKRSKCERRGRMHIYLMQEWARITTYGAHKTTALRCCTLLRCGYAQYTHLSSIYRAAVRRCSILGGYREWFRRSLPQREIKNSTLKPNTTLQKILRTVKKKPRMCLYVCIPTHIHAQLCRIREPYIMYSQTNEEDVHTRDHCRQHEHLSNTKTLKIRQLSARARVCACMACMYILSQLKMMCTRSLPRTCASFRSKPLLK